MASRLGQMLIEAKLISSDQLQEALSVQQKDGGRIGTSLVKLGFLGEEKLAAFLSKQYGIPAVDLSKQDIDPNVVKLIPPDVARKYNLMPIARRGATLVIAMVDPSNVFAIDDVKFMTGYNVEPVVSTESAISDGISEHYTTTDALQTVIDNIKQRDEFDVLHEEEEEIDLIDLKAAVEEAPVVKLVNLIIAEAIGRRASDIHIEPYEKSFRVRYRIDGVLQEIMAPPPRLKAALTSRLKIMAELDIAERRLPQDGRIKIRMKDREVDLRVSTLPALFGEKIVMRILDKGSLVFDLTKLGFESHAMQDFENAIASPYGMVLVTGPTGSGKTTTLYSALKQLNVVATNIMTAEDPVEYNFPGINQVQMKEEIGLNFAAALRSFLRQDPDIIMVGEVRDYETAEIAVKAALTGHLVLSTLHTNDAPSTITRLLNMGVEPFLVASSVLLIVAQRLARKVCHECKEEEEDVSPQALTSIGFSPDEAESLTCYRGQGCRACSNTGYRGRIALYEVMAVKEETRDLILQGASAGEIKRKAVELGMRTLRMSGLEKIREGVSSVDEVVRVTFGD